MLQTKPISFVVLEVVAYRPQSRAVKYQARQHSDEGCLK